MLSRPGTKRPRPRTRYPGRSKTDVRARRLIYSALPIVPGRRVRGEGAAPTEQWCCPRTRSMARLQRLQLSAAFSRVKVGAAMPDRPQPVPHRARDRARRARGHAADASRQHESERARYTP